MKYITKTIWILSIISLFTDMASEMLYPIMPIYLKSIGFTVFTIGVLEGMAEAVAGLSKGYFGKKSDIMGRRVPFVQLGYGLSAISKPMIALFSQVWWVFIARSLDRFGKGIRTGARDALLSDESTPETRGRIFGFHRSMDTLGAVLGPSMALLYLYFHPNDYRTLFLLAFLPGMLAILATTFLKDKPTNMELKEDKPSFFSFLNYVKTSNSTYKKLIFGFLCFTIVNSSDAFLILKVKESGISDTYTIALYIFYNLVYVLAAYPLGILADKIGLKYIYIFGLSIFVIVYVGMGITNDLYLFVLIFLLYGVYAASTEGISKAWISKIVPKSETGTAIGSYGSFQSIFTLISSSLSGFIWFMYGAEVMFIFSGLIAGMVGIYFYFLPTDHDAA